MSRRLLVRTLLVLIAGFAICAVQSSAAVPAQACTPNFQDPEDPGDSDLTGCPQTQAKWAAGAAAIVAGVVAVSPLLLGFIRLAGVGAPAGAAAASGRNRPGSAGARVRDPGFLSRPEGFRMPPPGGQAFDPAPAGRVEPWGLNDARTHGLLVRGDGLVVALRSGSAGTDRALPIAPFSVRSHVEFHAATALAPGENATLYLNRLPCGARAGAVPGCEQNLPRYLAAGARLTVYGPDGYSRLVSGGVPVADRVRGPATGRPWLQAGWTGQRGPAPIRGEADLQAAIDAVLRLADAGQVGEILRLRRADGTVIEAWLDFPARGGWALSVTDPDGRCWLTGSGPVPNAGPELDFRYYDGWSRIPVSSIVPARAGRPALLELAATGRRSNSVPWRAF